MKFKKLIVLGLAVFSVGAVATESASAIESVVLSCTINRRFQCSIDYKNVDPNEAYLYPTTIILNGRYQGTYFPYGRSQGMYFPSGSHPTVDHTFVREN